MRSTLLEYEEQTAAMEDKRTFFRNYLYDLRARLKNIDTGERFDAQASDISGSGLGLTMGAEFSEGDVFEVSLDIPDGLTPVTLLARVVWVKDMGFLGSRAGLSVLNPKFMSVARILKVFY